MNHDAELLRRYVEEGANEAFAGLVRRHVNFVYSAALRQLNGDAHLAADATQLVFTDLARKSATLLNHRVLAGWLFTSTRYTTAKLVRAERRRQARETEAQLMQEITDDDSISEADWRRVRAVLDDAMNELKETDRHAILVRFFEGRDYAGVGARLNLAENTARMRVERALDRLRAQLERRGLRSTSAALAAALAGEAVLAAPAGLATSVSTAALAGAGTTAAVGLAAQIGHFMTMTKLQLGVSGALAAAGATGLIWQANANDSLRDEVGRLREESTQIQSLQAENLRLGRRLAEAEGFKRDDAEFTRLQQEAGGLRTRLAELARAEQAAPRTVQERSLDAMPVVRVQARPAYPVEMKAAGISGEVIVEFVVDANGDVQNPTAVRSTRREFEAAAVEAVGQWKFKAGIKGGRQVPTKIQVPVTFSLNGATGAATAPTETAVGVVRQSPVIVSGEEAAGLKEKMTGRE